MRTKSANVIVYLLAALFALALCVALALPFLYTYLVTR
jgi:hypothetical protein